MITGFASISDVQLYWASCEETFLSFPNHYNDLEKPLSQLYALVIEYQASAICHLSQKQLSRAWEKATGAMDWKAKEAKIKATSEQCKSFIGLGQQKEIRDHNAKQLSLMESSYTVQRQILQTLQEDRQEDLEMQVQHHLIAAAPTYAADKDFNPIRVSGTCEWFLEDDRFKSWRDHESSSLLWVSAAPGCGKSVLSRTLVDEGHLNTSKTTIQMNPSDEITSISTKSTVCYFFFKEGDESRQRSNAALCAMLHQVFSNDTLDNRIKYALPSHRSFGKSLTLNFSELWNIFLQCAAEEGCGDLICVFDGLDECNERSRKELIAKLSDFYLQDDKCKSHRLKVLITSRPYDDIEALMRQFSQHAAYVRLDGGDKTDQISEEINLVIDAKVDEFARSFEADDRQKIANHLKQMGTRTYLTLHLIINIIEQSPSDYSRESDVEELLSGLPLEITDAYEKILSRVKNPQKTAALLQLLLAATRPLTLEEANYALTIALAKKPFATFQAVKAAIWPVKEFKKVVRNLSGLLVDVYDGKLSFIHLTAREFLVTQDCQQDERKWKGRFSNTKTLQETITRCCIHYMLLSDLPRRITSLRWGQFPFCEYAGTRWLYHYGLQDKAAQDGVYNDLRRICRATGPEIYTWGYGKLFRRQCWTDLAIASYLRLGSVAKRLVENENHEIDAWCGFFGTALQAACAAGHADVVKILVECGADVNVQTGFHGTALQAAAACGFLEICEFLVAQGALVNTVGGHFGSALRAAVYLSHLDVVKFLLDKGAHFDVTEDFIITGCNCAYNGKRITTELLEICGQKLVISDTLLQYAAGFLDDVDPGVIQAFLEADNHRVEVTEEVLYQAIKANNGRIFKLLLQHRKDKSPLTERLVIRAAENGDEDMFESVILLSNYKKGSNPVPEKVLVATAENAANGTLLRSILLTSYDVCITPRAIEKLASRSPQVHIRLMLAKCKEPVELKPEAMITGIGRAHMDYDEIHDLLNDATFPTSNVTVNTIELAAARLSGREMMLLLTLYPEDSLAVTKFMIIYALGNTQYGPEVLETLLKFGKIESLPKLTVQLWQNTISTAANRPEILGMFFVIFDDPFVPDEILISAIQQDGPRTLTAAAVLLYKRGNPIPTHGMIDAAMKNTNYGGELITFFLTKYRPDMKVTINSLNLRDPEISLSAVRAVLLNCGIQNPLTQDVLSAAVKSANQAMKLFQLFFEICPEKVVVTDELMEVAARTGAGSVIGLWLERRCVDLIPEKLHDVLRLAYAKLYEDEYGIAQLEKKGVRLERD